MRIFLDANVLFSAAKSDGPVSELVAMLRRAGHECWVDGYVIEEARRNLTAKAPHRTQVLERILSQMQQRASQRNHAELDALLSSLPLAPKDQPVLAAAIQHTCSALVTGDRTHFKDLYGHTIRGVTIYSPRSIAEKLFAS